jgi:ferredoxin
MCEFCHRHGEGQKWYLAAANYSEELFGEAARSSIRAVLKPLSGQLAPSAEPSAAQQKVFSMAPGVVRWVARRHQQDVHWGQVVPLEDALQMIGMLDWVVRLPCACRSQTVGDRNARYCFGLGIAPLEEPQRQLFREAVDPALSLETLTREQAQEAITALDQRGAMHSVWTFKTPFIGGLCNCDRDCQAYRAQTQWKFQCMFRAEYVAQVDPESCRGCRRCMRQCLFGAIHFSLSQERCAVNQAACYGCGVCRATCERGAISLLPRASVPAAARTWGI